MENKISSVFLPLSGSEPKYTPSQWNKYVKKREMHNCYAYFLQDLQNRNEKEDSFPQPGAFALHRRKLIQKYSDQKPETDANKFMGQIKEPYSCDEITSAVLYDNPTILAGEREVACPTNYYKGFMAVDSNQKDSDYHFWIQNSDGAWSHKPGKLDATDKDASGNRIVDPFLSDRGRYDTPCGYFCVPANSYQKTNSRG